MRKGLESVYKWNISVVICLRPLYFYFYRPLKQQSKSNIADVRPVYCMSKPVYFYFYRPLKQQGKSNIADDVAVPDTFMTQFRDYNIDKTISNIEGQIDEGQLFSDEEDVIPQAANEMGAGII